MTVRFDAWTSAADTRLRELWAEGHSGAEIARRMGTTKNAVVGRAHRLKLPARPSPIRLPAEPRAVRPAIVRSEGVRTLHARGAASLERAQESTRQLRAEAFRRHAQPGGGIMSPDTAAHTITAPAVDPARPGTTAEAGAFVAGMDVSSQTSPTAVSKPPSVFSGLGRVCCWPLWSDSTPKEERRFCDAARVHGAYCAEHGARAYTRRFEEPGEEPHRVTRSTFAWGGRAA